MGATDSMTSVRRRSLALRTMAGVVAVVALALAALMVTTLGIAGHVVTSQLRDTLTESWRRTSSFVSTTGPVPGASLPGFKDPGGGSGSTNTNSSNTGSSPTDTATKNPINAPGLPAGGIVMAQVNELVDGKTTRLPRVDVPADWVSFVVPASRPHLAAMAAPGA